jgi:hypothetical protein
LSCARAFARARSACRLRRHWPSWAGRVESRRPDSTVAGVAPYTTCARPAAALNRYRTVCRAGASPCASARHGKGHGLEARGLWRGGTHHANRSQRTPSIVSARLPAQQPGCGWRDSNPHGLTPKPLRAVRVYRFHHTRYHVPARWRDRYCDRVLENGSAAGRGQGGGTNWDAHSQFTALRSATPRRVRPSARPICRPLWPTSPPSPIVEPAGGRPRGADA